MKRVGQKITETMKLLKICYIAYLTLIVFVLRSYIDELKWRINNEWADLGRALSNVLLASCANVHGLRSWWKRTFWAHGVIKTMWRNT